MFQIQPMTNHSRVHGPKSIEVGSIPEERVPLGNIISYVC